MIISETALCQTISMTWWILKLSLLFPQFTVGCNVNCSQPYFSLTILNWILTCTAFLLFLRASLKVSLHMTTLLSRLSQTLLLTGWTNCRPALICQAKEPLPGVFPSNSRHTSDLTQHGFIVSCKIFKMNLSKKFLSGYLFRKRKFWPELPGKVRARLNCNPEIPDIVPLHQLGVKHVAGLGAPPEHQLENYKITKNYKEGNSPVAQVLPSSYRDWRIQWLSWRS